MRMSTQPYLSQFLKEGKCRDRRRLGRFLAGALVCLLYAAPVFAQCDATLSASLSGDGRTINFTATGVATGDPNYVLDIEAYRDGQYWNKKWGENYPDIVTYSDTIPTACLSAGPHTIRADVRCSNGTDSASAPSRFRMTPR